MYVYVMYTLKKLRTKLIRLKKQAMKKEQYFFDWNTMDNGKACYNLLCYPSISPVIVICHRKLQFSTVLCLCVYMTRRTNGNFQHPFDKWTRLTFTVKNYLAGIKRGI
jgi:hypothetical protein